MGGWCCQRAPLFPARAKWVNQPQPPQVVIQAGYAINILGVASVRQHLAVSQLPVIAMPYKSIEARRAANRRWREKAIKAGYFRDYANQNKERIKEQKARSRAAGRHKNNARRKVQYMVQSGQWPPATFWLCNDCDKKAQHYHHEDYSQPLNVEPLCTRCHGIRHSITTPDRPST